MIETVCDGCPIMNTDHESGCTCNLNYEIQYSTFGVFHHYSNNCKLIKIVTEDEIIENKTI